MSTGSGQRLLLVDDNPTRRSELGFALESRHGYRVPPAADVRDARERLAESQVYVAVVTQPTLVEQDAIPLLPRVTRTTGVAPVVVVIATPDEQCLRRLAWSERAN